MNERYMKWFSDLYDKGYGELYRYLSLMLFRAGRNDLYDEIPDCIQETFILVWRKRETLYYYKNANAWIRKTAQNLMNNKRSISNTRAKHTAFSLDNEFVEGGEPLIQRINIMQSPPDDDADELLFQIKNDIGEETYALLIEYYDKEQTISKIMGEHGLSKSGVKMRVKRALDRLRKNFKKL